MTHETKIGKRVQEFWKLNPKASLTACSKATGASLGTARKFKRQLASATKGSTEAPPASPPNDERQPPVGGLKPEIEGGEGGHDFPEVYPVQPKKQAKKPTQDKKPEPEPQQETVEEWRFTL